MKLITEPHVHLLAEPVFHAHPEYQLPKWKFPADALIAHAGKGCYDAYGADGRSIREHITSLIRSKHGSVLEHANFTLFITGISRGLSHEFVRHRAGFAYSQRSTRYTKEEGAAMVLSPYMADIYTRYTTEPETTTGAEQGLLTDFTAGCQAALFSYAACVSRLMEITDNEIEQKDLCFIRGSQDHRKWARGQGRQLLPHALETRMTVTGNLRAWRYFFEQRSSRWAEDEIRRLAFFIFSGLATRAGMALSDYNARTLRDYPEYTTTETKV